MIPPAQMENILELHNLAKESAVKFDKKRFIYEDVKKLLGNRLFIGIAGLRGIGKTVLLRQLSRKYTIFWTSSSYSRLQHPSI
jgi:predicted AAA+ superfamily ATPase